MNFVSYGTYPANIYLFKVNSRIARKRCEICSKVTIKTPERRRSVIFIVTFENIAHMNFHEFCKDCGDILVASDFAYRHTNL